jgi:AcrR family transcriptional regulator
MFSFKDSKINNNPQLDAAPKDEPDGRKKRGIRRQRAVLDVARELLLEKGYKGTTLEAIIERAGGSRVTIYRVFGGKSGLISAIISQGTLQLVDSLISPMALKLPPRKALMQLRYGVRMRGAR